jgi:hypothetical protein
MSLFQCEVCGCCENTALACQGFKFIDDCFDWAYAPERQGLKICSACGPVLYANNEGPTEYGKWHDRFPRTFLPLGQFHTNRVGNLEHTESGSEDFRAFTIESPL